MRIANYRLVLSFPKRSGSSRPLVRIALPIAENDAVVQVRDLLNAEAGSYVEFSVPVGVSAAVYFGCQEAGQKEQDVAWSDPVPVLGSESPARVQPTLFGKLYWVQCETLNVAIGNASSVATSENTDTEKNKKDASADVTQIGETTPTVDTADATPTANIVDEAASSEHQPINGPVAENTELDTDDAEEDELDEQDEEEYEEYLTYESFAELSVAQKRAYLREVELATSIDMRSNAAMLDGYAKFLLDADTETNGE